MVHAKSFITYQLHYCLPLLFHLFVKHICPVDIDMCPDSSFPQFPAGAPIPRSYLDR